MPLNLPMLGNYPMQLAKEPLPPDRLAGNDATRIRIYQPHQGSRGDRLDAFNGRD